jgi:hypothetical protein
MGDGEKLTAEKLGIRAALSPPFVVRPSPIADRPSPIS